MKKVIIAVLIMAAIMTITVTGKEEPVKAEGESRNYHVENINNGTSRIENTIKNSDGTVTVVVCTGNRCNVYTLENGEKLFGEIDIATR